MLYCYFSSLVNNFALMLLVVSAISNARIEELLLEDQNVKRRRERYQKQSSLLSKLTRQLSIHDNRAAAASSLSNGSVTGTLFVILFVSTNVALYLQRW